MSLILCPECKKEISDTVVQCPHCGLNIKKYNKQIKKTMPETIEKQRRIKKVLTLASIFGVLLFLIIGISIFWKHHFITDYVGQPLQQVVSILNKKNITYNISLAGYSFDYDKNVVTNQSIKANSLSFDKEITIYISEGRKYIIPECEGCDESVLEQEPFNLLDVRKEYSVSKRYEEGIIEECFPAPGNEINEGSIVNITVSKGKEKNIPIYAGLGIEEAKEKLEEAGLKYTIVETYSIRQKGQIVSFEPSVYVDAGETISVVVSKGLGISVEDYSDRIWNKELERNYGWYAEFTYNLVQTHDDMTIDCMHESNYDDYYYISRQEPVSGTYDECDEITLYYTTAAIVITAIDWKINSVGGVDTYITFKNVSDKEISYVNFEVKYYDKVGYPCVCSIRNRSTATLNYTGPLKAGKSSGKITWNAVVYNYSMGVIQPLSAEIIFTDGTSQKLTYTGRYWYSKDYYGGELH